MGSVIDFDARKRRRSEAAAHPRQTPAGNIVTCAQCGEPHPIVRLRGGEQRCVTAFFDGAHWFCRNRGCRRAWLGGSQEI
jgi:hypothetical protein